MWNLTHLLKSIFKIVLLDFVLILELAVLILGVCWKVRVEILPSLLETGTVKVVEFLLL